MRLHENITIIVVKVSRPETTYLARLGGNKCKAIFSIVTIHEHVNINTVQSCGEIFPQRPSNIKSTEYADSRPSKPMKLAEARSSVIENNVVHFSARNLGSQWRLSEAERATNISTNEYCVG